MSDVSSGHDGHVSEAVRIVRVQTDCTMEEAFVLMHERATMLRVTMEEVIDGVIAGRTVFGDTVS